jgi:alpha-ribazole phosphatase
MTITSVYLVRHGQVEGFDTCRINGQTDVQLTDFGRAQARAVARRLSGVPLAAVYSSDLSRAVYGAHCVAETRTVAHVALVSLREQSFGIWEGSRHREVEQMEHASITALFARLMTVPPPGGESLAQLHARVGTVLDSLLLRHVGQNICIVAHSGVNRVILSRALCGGPGLFWRLDQGYGALSIVGFGAHNGPIVRLLNEANTAGTQPDETATATESSQP